jgi:hypothetical protein
LRAPWRLRPKFIVADEPVSALDVSVGAQIVNLLQQLQRDFGLTYLFISHSMPVVRYLSTRIAVMYRGKMVEIGDTEQITARPQHDYTRKLAGGHAGVGGRLSAAWLLFFRRKKTTISICLPEDFMATANPSVSMQFPEEPAPLSEGRRLIDTFFAPRKTFTDLRRNASWWAPYLIIAVFPRCCLFPWSIRRSAFAK